MKNTKDLLNRLDKVKRGIEYESSKRTRLMEQGIPVTNDAAQRVEVVSPETDYYKSLVLAKDDQIRGLQQALADAQHFARNNNLESFEIKNLKETISELESIIEQQDKLIQIKMPPIVAEPLYDMEAVNEQLKAAEELAEFYGDKKNFETTWRGTVVKEDGQLARNYRDKYIKKST